MRTATASLRIAASVEARRLSRSVQSTEPRCAVHRVKANASDQHRKDVVRAITAEKEAVVEKRRADAFEATIYAIVADLKRMGLRLDPRK